jgi:phage shock protein A
MDEEKVLTAIAAVASAVGALDSKVAALDNKVAALDNKVAALDNKFAALDNKFAALDSRFTALDNTVTRLRVDVMARLDRHENALTAIRGDIAVNMHRADRVHNHSENTRSELRDLSTQVGAMEQQQRHMGERITALENGRAYPTP